MLKARYIGTRGEKHNARRNDRRTKHIRQRDAAYAKQAADRARGVTAKAYGAALTVAQMLASSDCSTDVLKDESHKYSSVTQIDVTDLRYSLDTLIALCATIRNRTHKVQMQVDTALGQTSI